MPGLYNRITFRGDGIGFHGSLLNYFPPVPPPAPADVGWIRRTATQAVWTFFWLLFVAACAGVVSPLLAGHFWAAEILCHFQPQYAIGLAALAVPLAICRRWKGLALVLGVLAIATAVWIAPLYFGSPLAGPRKLRVLSANVGCANRSPERFLKLVEAERPDVILIFELTHPWASTLKLDALGYPYSSFAPSPGHSGCGIFSRYPLEDARIQAVNPYPNFVPTAELTLGDRKLRIFGTHPLAPYNPAELALRNQQMVNLAEIVGPEARSTIVAGDLNTSNWSPCFRGFLRSTGLNDTRLGFGPLTTFPASFRLIQTTIDHCLVSPDIAVVDRRVGPDIGSDHLPIIVDLTWDD